jgi:hypothetical protein
MLDLTPASRWSRPEIAARSEERGLRFQSIAVVAFLVACCAWYIWSDGVKAAQELPKPSDLSVFLDAGRALASGNTPYSDSRFHYPPLLALLALTLAPFDYLTARILWFIFSQVCVLAGAYLIWRFLGKSRASLCVVAAVWAFGGAARENFAVGQLGPLLVFLLAAAYTERRLRGGLAVGFGFGLKFIPGVLALPLLLGRRWKEIAGALLGCAASLTLPWALMYGFAGPKSPARMDRWMGTPSVLSWSVPSSVLRALEPATKGPSLPPGWEAGDILGDLRLPERDQLAALWAGIAVLIAGAVLLVVINRRPTLDQMPFAMAGLISLALAASPISWAHYQLMQYPGLAILLCELFRRKAWTALSLAIVGALALYQIPVAALTPYYLRYGRWTAESPATLFIWTNVTPTACLLLFGLHMHVYKR